MSWFQSNIIENPILNPFGAVAKGIQNSNGGDALTRVTNWFKANNPLPGCDGSLVSNCDFPGTSADWEAYRRDFIDGCTAENSSGVFVSKNKTRAACQSMFDEKTYKVREKFAKQNEVDRQYIQGLIGEDNPLLYLLIFFFVGLIVYLLLSK